jgi:CRP/FNR family cyclic AMP-dependent transcriptional regulator
MSKKQLSGPMSLNLSAGEIVCAAGEEKHDLYIIHSGKLMVFVTKGTQVTPVAYLEGGEYLGELSFFDGMPRSAHVVAIEDSSLIKIPSEELGKQFPNWLITLAKSITSKLRHTDEVIRTKGIRKKNVETINALSIEEQRHYYQLLKDYADQNGITL